MTRFDVRAHFDLLLSLPTFFTVCNRRNLRMCQSDRAKNLEHRVVQTILAI